MQRMLEAVSKFPVNATPTLDDKISIDKISIDDVNKRIGYVDATSGVPDYSASYGYYTAFSWMYLIENGSGKWFLGPLSFEDQSHFSSIRKLIHGTSIK